MFAVDEPHPFRHMFGPIYAVPYDPAQPEGNSVSYQMPCQRLDDLQARGPLRPGIREGLDLLAWTMVHGFAFLVLDGFLPLDVGQRLIDALARLTLPDPALRLPPGRDPTARPSGSEQADKGA